jgi:hypothetical protein
MKKQFQTLKKPIQDGKIPVGRFIQESILAETYRKKQRGRDEFYKGLLKLSQVLLRNKAVFLAMKILRITTLNG